MENSTKELILRVAENLFATKGFSDTKISDISSRVQVSDSTVYEHFQNKEDILFTIPRKNTEKLIRLNESHLRGLVGAEVKLRKLIWNYLEFMTQNRDYTNLLLFDLRPTRAFYQTENHRLIREFTGIYRNVIIEGQKEGNFWPEVSPTLILNLIFGTIDLLLITWLIQEKPEDPLSLFAGLFDLVEHAVVRRSRESKNHDKRTQILNAAVKVFSELGFKKARIQDISKLAGVADGTIYKYFRSKEEILFTLPVENTKELIGIQREHLSGLKDTDLKLAVLLKDYLHYIQTHKDYSSIVYFDLRYNRAFYQTDAYQLFRDFARIFYDVIVDGISRQHFRAEVNPYVATKMIFGLTDHVVLSWIIFRRPRHITNLSDPICDLILNALSETHRPGVIS